MNGYNCVANNLTIAALVFLGAKVGEHREMIFHWLIFLVFCLFGILSLPFYIHESCIFLYFTLFIVEFVSIAMDADS